MSPVVWSILLLFVGLLLIMLEVFIPSGGVIGFLSISAVMAAIFTAFYNHGLEVGMIFLTVAAIAIPVVMAVAFRYWPQTPLGKRVLLEVPTESEILPEDSPQLRALRKLVGKVGVAKSMMLPSGSVMVDGMTFDAVSEGMAIEAGESVRVVEVRGNRVVVSLTSDTVSVELKEDPNDILSRPLESLGLEDEPLA